MKKFQGIMNKLSSWSVIFSFITMVLLLIIIVIVIMNIRAIKNYTSVSETYNNFMKSIAKEDELVQWIINKYKKKVCLEVCSPAFEKEFEPLCQKMNCNST